MKIKKINLGYKFTGPDKYGDTCFDVEFRNLKKEKGFDFLKGESFIAQFLYKHGRLMDSLLKKNNIIPIDFLNCCCFFSENIDKKYWTRYMKENFKEIEFSNCNEFLAKMKSFAGYCTELPHTRMHPSRVSYDEEYIDLINPKDSKKKYTFEILHWEIIKRPKKVFGLKGAAHCKITIEGEEILFRLDCISIPDLLEENNYLAIENQRKKYIAVKTRNIKKIEKYIRFLFSPENINVGSADEMRLKVATFSPNISVKHLLKKNFTDSKKRYRVELEEVEHIERDTTNDW